VVQKVKVAVPAGTAESAY